MEQMMMDLETWGTEPGCCIRSIGAVHFSLGDQVGGNFYVNITDQSCLDAGLTIDSATQTWWHNPIRAAANAALTSDQVSLTAAVVGFHDFFQDCGAKYLWCHGMNFDEPIWRHAANLLNLPVPWSFRNVRDTRTIFHVHGLGNVSRQGTYHNALDDAAHQARCVQLALRNGVVIEPKQSVKVVRDAATPLILDRE